MRAMTVDELRSLIAHENAPCISIYMPTHRARTPDDRAQFQGHVREARKLLLQDRPQKEVDAILGPILELDDAAFWDGQLDGLALFRTREFTAHYTLPMQVEHLTVVADSFHIRPALQFLQSNQRYFLLNLSLNRASFFKGNAMGVVPVEVPRMPRSVDDVSDPAHERVTQVHASTRTASGKEGSSSMFHGPGKVERIRDEEVLRYFRAIDKALWEFLRDETAPLVLAATTAHHPVYASVTRYAHLLREGPHGNFDNARIEDLHAKAWPIVQHHLIERENEVLEHYGNAIKRHRAADTVETVAEAAVHGRVRELLIMRGAQLWGRLDAATGAIELHGKQKDSRDDDVIDDISEAVILRGGQVYAFDRDRMPTKSPVAAALRW